MTLRNKNKTGPSALGALGALLATSALSLASLEASATPFPIPPIDLDGQTGTTVAAFDGSPGVIFSFAPGTTGLGFGFTNTSTVDYLVTHYWTSDWLGVSGTLDGAALTPNIVVNGPTTDGIGAIANFDRSFTFTIAANTTTAQAYDFFWTGTNGQVPYQFFYEAQLPSSVPESGSLALLGLGLAGIGLARRRKLA